MDCNTDSVTQTFQHAGFDAQLFLLPIRLGSQSCFVVMRGLYQTEKAANDSMTELSSYFMDRSDPPKTVRVGDYLN